MKDDNKNHPFFKAIPYHTYQQITRLTLYGTSACVSIIFALIVTTSILWYQLRIVQRETASSREQKEKFEAMALHKKELSEKLSPFYAIIKKRMSIIKKLTITNQALEKLFTTQEHMRIISCIIKKKKFIVVLQSTHADYLSWVKNLAESKLFNGVATTHVKKSDSHTTMTIEGNIIF